MHTATLRSGSVFGPATPRSRSGSVLQIFTVVRVTVSSRRRLLCTRCTWSFNNSILQARICESTFDPSHWVLLLHEVECLVLYQFPFRIWDRHNCWPTSSEVEDVLTWFISHICAYRIVSSRDLSSRGSVLLYQCAQYVYILPNSWRSIQTLPKAVIEYVWEIGRASRGM